VHAPSIATANNSEILLRIIISTRFFCSSA